MVCEMGSTPSSSWRLNSLDAAAGAFQLPSGRGMVRVEGEGLGDRDRAELLDGPHGDGPALDGLDPLALHRDVDDRGASLHAEAGLGDRCDEVVVGHLREVHPAGPLA